MSIDQGGRHAYSYISGKVIHRLHVSSSPSHARQCLRTLFAVIRVCVIVFGVNPAVQYVRLYRSPGLFKQWGSEGVQRARLSNGTYTLPPEED